MDTYLQYIYNSLSSALKEELYSIDSWVEKQKADLKESTSLLHRTETCLSGGHDDNLLEDIKEFLYS